MTQPKRIGIPPHFYCEPLARPLRNAAEVHLVPDAVAVNAVNLRSHRLDAALLGPLDYARDGSEYFIPRGVAISSRASNGSVAIHMREGVRKISSLAVDPSSNSEIVLAKIILKEEFDIEPVLVPLIGPLEAMLQKADAALLTGDQALRESLRRREALDLVESWVSLTGLPYVFAVWCTPERGLAGRELALLQQGADAAPSILTEIAADESRRQAFPGCTPEELAAYLESFSFSLTDDAEEGLKEYLKYLYYHGILADVPDLRYVPSPGTEGEAAGN